MREILFRGFTPKENGSQVVTVNGKQIKGEWVEGFLAKKADPLLGVMRSYIIVQEFDISCITGKPTTLKSTMTWYEVDPETIGQYIGLTDKNGKKIFEGDIVYNGFGMMGYIAYEYGSYDVKFSDGEVWSACQYIHEEYTSVIGNIYDSPELLNCGAKMDGGEKYGC